jgi:hypothetical protein
LAEVDRLQAAIGEHRDAFLGQDSTGSCYDCCAGCPLVEEDAAEWDQALWAVLDGVEVER